ncbi:membrane dipeptidase [Solirubrobacter sp. CPCC 204708]|uniref:Dipeptidase n=1 Tax=Solirubrobacter deserti TaxID=2282478 RepID=A0ABT4RU30_9ACTN|nr:membrane dipeptidase [Solirubrobacter deserti]MBE2314480.1 membrane dipeptidase [Solirubrobacter deserti]MDA0142087.1 dipeptidase [Solirubrobacter deserti]
MVDLHCHYPMHLLGGVEAPRDVAEKMLRVRAREAGKLRAAVLHIAARLFNFRHWDGGWRVSVPLLQQGGVNVACSVLYRPFSEMDLDEPYGAPPESAYYDRLVELLDATEQDVEARGHIVVRAADDLQRAQRTGRIAFVHCVEGGFHLGATPAEVTEHVHELAERGVLYITLAHLFWRRVATNAPALPFLPDALYDLLFPQSGVPPLTDLGEAAVKACDESGIVVDISHMREDAIDATFDLLSPDAQVMASHAGYRFGGQRYNLTDATLARVAARGGVVGLILAQHQLNDGVRRTNTRTLAQTLDVIDRHVEKIGPDHVALGSDLDGFIKPTMGGVESAADLQALADGIRARHPGSADRILAQNALRVIDRRFS